MRKKHTIATRLYETGKANLGSKRPQDAVNELEAAEDGLAGLDKVVAQHSKGVAYRDLKDYQSALTALMQAHIGFRRYDIFCPETVRQLADVCLHTGDYTSSYMLYNDGLQRARRADEPAEVQQQYAKGKIRAALDTIRGKEDWGFAAYQNALKDLATDEPYQVEASDLGKLASDFDLSDRAWAEKIRAHIRHKAVPATGSIKVNPTAMPPPSNDPEVQKANPRLYKRM